MNNACTSPSFSCSFGAISCFFQTPSSVQLQMISTFFVYFVLFFDVIRLIIIEYFSDWLLTQDFCFFVFQQKYDNFGFSINCLFLKLTCVASRIERIFEFFESKIQNFYACKFGESNLNNKIEFPKKKPRQIFSCTNIIPSESICLNHQRTTFFFNSQNLHPF